MRQDLVVSTTAQTIRAHPSTLLGLLLEGTEAGSGVEEFLAGLAALAAAELSTPEREVSCGFAVERRKQPTVMAGSTGDTSAGSLRIPLLLDADRSAVVSFYSAAGPFSSDDVEHAHHFAVEASRALLIALNCSQLRDSRDDLAAALQSRTIIDLAIGAIMAQNRCGREAAFKILRNTSNNRNLKIRDVARAVVASIAGDTDVTARFED